MDESFSSPGEVHPTLPPVAAHILLAEDNVINQRVISMLIKKMGYTVEVAADGREVLSCLRHAQYDLILMDCQMPVMDGYEATAAIRANGGRLAALPIIAVTANALAGEAEKCIAAGMNDYLPKPVRMEDLRAALTRWLSRSEALSPVNDVSREGADMIDMVALREDMDNDEAFLRQTAGMFVQRAEQVMHDLRDALERQDFAALAALSHEMKGMCLTFYVQPSVPEQLLHLEEAARAHDAVACRQMLHAGLLPVLTNLNAEIERMLASLKGAGQD